MAIKFFVVIMIITVLVSYFAEQRPELKVKLMHFPYKVKRQKEYYRLLTSGFVHGDFMHLLFNMITLYFFANALEPYFDLMYGPQLGKLAFLGLYLGGIIVSDLPTFFQQKDNPQYASLGASGGVASVIFATILLAPLSTIYLYFLPVPAFIFAILYLVYSYYFSRNSRDGISHSAHFFGSLYGLGYMIALDPTIVGHFINELSNFKGLF